MYPCTQVPLYMPTQIKFVVDDALAERFKRAVLAKRGKLELSREGEEALRLYLREQERAPRRPARDPLLDAIGMVRSKGRVRPDALQDKKSLYDED